MEQKPKLVEQVTPGLADDGLDGIFGSNQDETMRIDANVAKTPVTCDKFFIQRSMFPQIFVWKSNSHGET